MKFIRRGLLNLLIFFQVFIVFFLLFENRIQVPASLQVLGRMHPLLLHFPIVLLVLLWGMACLGSTLNIERPQRYQLIQWLLLVTAWATAITVVAGLILSKEGGYEDAGFLWHKWMGVALSFLCTGLFVYYRRKAVMAVPAPDFLRIGLGMAVAILLVAGHFGAGLTHGTGYLWEPVQHMEQKKQYDFPAADAALVAQLNTPYRLVKPLAQGSPALSVDFFGKDSFTEQSLKELEPVALQVVSLSLSGMPLSDRDRELLGNFTNLRELVLNQTSVDDGWSEVLATLPDLRKLSLSSTGVTEVGLATILDMPKLTQVFVWNTTISVDALNKLQLEHQGVTIEQGYRDDGQTILPLNNPVVTPVRTFFNDKITVTLSHPIAGVALHYTLDGSEPDSIHSPVYKEPFPLEATASMLRVKGYKSGWLASAEVSRVFRRSVHRPDHVYLLSSPEPRYKGRGALSLVDLESGGDNHGDGKWLGFHGQPVKASFHFDQEIHVDTIGIRVKQLYGAHIYPPKTIRVWGGIDSVHTLLLSSVQPALEKPEATSANRFIEISATFDSIRYLRLEMEPFVPIPKGYPAEGNPAWIFVDEVVIN